MIAYEQAREKIVAAIRELRGPLTAETFDLLQACGRVLSQPIVADRDYPPFNRSIRDGFALRAEDGVPGATLHCIGEIRAGGSFEGSVGPGECVQIMTGAAVPQGADAVVMIEHVSVDADRVMLSRPVTRGQAIVARGAEARDNQQLLPAGTRLNYAEMALAGQVGSHRVQVNKRPCAAILSTGDEVVDVAATPGPLQVRNGNSVALETLAKLAGAEAESLGNAPDEKKELRRRIERGLESDLLIISGGVSMGKYDLVETVLAELGAKFLFDSVAIRPGRPAVFGICRGKPVFGLPGNPVSTMVTFELFVSPGIDVLSGAEPRDLPTFRARLTHAVHERGELTHFLPAHVERRHGDPQVSVLAWQGSGDVVTMAESNAFLVVSPEKLEWDAGEMALVLPRGGST